MNKGEAEVVIKDTIDYANKEIKKTKKKYRTILLAIVLVLVAVVLFLALKPVSLNYGEGDLFTEDDIKSAMECVMEDFKSLQGCKLFSLTYPGDAKSLREKEYQTKYGPQYDEYIVIHSLFLPPFSSGGAWQRGFYTWDWILGRNDNGKWTVISRGYC